MDWQVVDLQVESRAAVDKFKNDQSAALKALFLTVRLKRGLMALQFPENSIGLYGASARNALPQGSSTTKKQKKEQRFIRDMGLFSKPW